MKKLCKGPSTSGGITQLEVEKWGMKEVELRPHQLEGITWLAERCDQSRGCILGDEMGLGKTLQARDELPTKLFSFMITTPLCTGCMCVAVSPQSSQEGLSGGAMWVRYIN